MVVRGTDCSHSDAGSENSWIDQAIHELLQWSLHGRFAYRYSGLRWVCDDFGRWLWISHLFRGCTWVSHGNIIVKLIGLPTLDGQNTESAETVVDSASSRTTGLHKTMFFSHAALATDRVEQS